MKILEEDGYWTTEGGQTYFLSDIYFTDRATGEIYYETHPVFLAENTAAKLGQSWSSFKNAIDNGTQNIVEMNGQLYAGDQILDTAIPADGSATTNSAQQGAELWDALTQDQQSKSMEHYR